MFYLTLTQLLTAERLFLVLPSAEPDRMNSNIYFRPISIPNPPIHNFTVGEDSDRSICQSRQIQLDKHL